MVNQVTIKSSMLLVFLTLMTITLTGCWDSKEIDELGIVTGLGVDKSDEGGKYEVTVETVNPREVAGGMQSTGKSSSTTIYSAKGDTVIGAIRRISQLTSREVYFSQIQNIIFGEDLVKSGIKETFDLLERDNDFQIMPRVYIARNNTAKEVLSILAPLEKIPGQKLLKMGDVTGKVLGESITVKPIQFVQDYTTVGKASIISGISVVGNPWNGMDPSNIEQTIPKSITKSNGIAILKNGRLKRWVEKEDARGILWILNKVKSTVVNLDCKDKSSGVAINITNIHSTMKATIKNGEPNISIHVTESGEVKELLCNLDVTDSESINQLEKQLEEKTSKEILNAVEIAKQENSDIFGFAKAINLADKKKWKEIKNDFDTLLPEIKVNIKVEAHVSNTGMRTNSYLK